MINIQLEKYAPPWGAYMKEQKWNFLTATNKMRLGQVMNYHMFSLLLPAFRLLVPCSRTWMIATSSISRTPHSRLTQKQQQQQHQQQHQRLQQHRQQQQHQKATLCQLHWCQFSKMAASACQISQRSVPESWRALCCLTRSSKQPYTANLPAVAPSTQIA